MILSEETESGPAWWIDRIVDGMHEAESDERPVAETVVRVFQTASRPVAMECSDGETYILKAPQVDPVRHWVTRAIFTDHVVGILGAAMRAPVPAVRIVEIPPELAHTSPTTEHMVAGPAHGSLLVEHVEESRLIKRLADDDNRTRFARLAILYGWFHAADQQWLYRTTPEYEVFSHDHGHFLPGEIWWSRLSLQRATELVPDAALQGAGHFSRTELRDAAASLGGIDNAMIARAVAAPPRSWGIPVPDRLAVALFLAQRRTAMFRMLFPEA